MRLSPVVWLGLVACGGPAPRPAPTPAVESERRPPHAPRYEASLELSVSTTFHDVITGDPALEAAAVVCDRNPGAAECTRIAVFARTYPRHERAARDVLDRGCARGQLDACIEMGRLHVWGDDDAPTEDAIARGMALLERACAGGLARGCLEAARAPHGQQVTRRYFERGCALTGEDAVASCVGLGRWLSETLRADLPAAYEAYRQACDRGHGPACIRQGQMLARGDGVAADAVTGRALLAHHCTGTQPVWVDDDCRSLGELLRDGLGGRKDLAGAAAVFERLCTQHEVYHPDAPTLPVMRSDPKSCDALAKLRKR